MPWFVYTVPAGMETYYSLAAVSVPLPLALPDHSLFWDLGRLSCHLSCPSPFTRSPVTMMLQKSGSFVPYFIHCIQKRRQVCYMKSIGVTCGRQEKAQAGDRNLWDWIQSKMIDTHSYFFTGG